ncbi:MAG: ABC transporter permease [Acidobacteria bacterium]|nr:ABC transporter permease [Acidobacteriota bacterium]
MGRYFPLVWKNASRNRRRSLLTISSLALSLCLLGLMMAIYHALYLSETDPAQALRLFTRNRVSITLPMPAFYLQRILAVGGVKQAMEFQWFGGAYKDARDPKNFFARFGIDPNKIFTLYAEMRMPEDQKKAFQSERTACIVGRRLAEKHNFRLGDRITLQGNIYPMALELVVRGIYDNELDPESLYFHWEYVRQAMPGRDQLSAISILADSPDSVPRIIHAVDEQFRNATVQTRTETERAFGLSFLHMMGNVKLILFSICAAVTFTIMLVSANTMAMSVRERVREIGILKTLGFRPSAILGIILSEAMLIALMGGIASYFLARALCGVIRSGPAFSSELMTLTIRPQVALVMQLAAVMIAFVSSFVPAWSAARINILEALRRTD